MLDGCSRDGLITIRLGMMVRGIKLAGHPSLWRSCERGDAMQLLVSVGGLLAVACGLYLAVGGFGAVPRGAARLSIVRPAWLALAAVGVTAVAFSAVWDWEDNVIIQGSAQAGAGADDEDDGELPSGEDADETKSTAVTTHRDGANDDEDKTTTDTSDDGGTCTARTVPHVVDLSVDEAVSAIEVKGLEPKPNAAEGTDLVQDSEPEAGTSVCEGDAVELTSCSSAIVPMLDGLTEEEALEELTSQGLNGTVSYEGDEDIEGGTFIRSAPIEGTVVCDENDVTIFVSDPELIDESCFIPDVTGLNPAAAKQTLEAASPHFSVIIKKVEVPAGHPEIGHIRDQDLKLVALDPCTDQTITLFEAVGEPTPPPDGPADETA